MPDDPSRLPAGATDPTTGRSARPAIGSSSDDARPVPEDATPPTDPRGGTEPERTGTTPSDDGYRPL
jgi:hypothetical protein